MKLVLISKNKKSYCDPSPTTFKSENSGSFLSGSLINAQKRQLKPDWNQLMHSIHSILYICILNWLKVLIRQSRECVSEGINKCKEGRKVLTEVQTIYLYLFRGGTGQCFIHTFMGLQKARQLWMSDRWLGSIHQPWDRWRTTLSPEPQASSDLLWVCYKWEPATSERKSTNLQTNSRVTPHRFRVITMKHRIIYYYYYYTCLF